MKNWKNMRNKHEKMEKNDVKRKKNEEIWIHTQNPRQFPWFCFGMCLFPYENQQPVLGGHRFSKEKCEFSLDVKQKYTFYRRKFTKQIAKVSSSYNNYSCRIMYPSNNINNNTIWWGSVFTGTSTPLWGVEACSHPIPAIPSYVFRTPHLHGAPTTEETIELWY